MKTRSLFTLLVPKFIVILAMLIISTVFAVGQAETKIPTVDIQQLKSGERTLLAGYIKAFPPFFYTNKENHPQGMGADIFNMIANNAGFKTVKFVAFNHFHELQTALQDGKIDVIVNNYWVTPERQQLFLFTKPYYRGDGLALIYLKEPQRDYKSLNDLKENPVGVLTNSHAQIWIQQNFPKTKFKDYGAVNELWDALQNDQVDAILTYNSLALDKLKEMKGEFNLVLLQPLDSVYAVRKQDTALQQALNESISTAWKNGSLNKIEGKYLIPLNHEKENL